MLTLILGGARSGKSDLAERLAAASGRPVLFIATAEARDDEMRERIAAHRTSRPAAWRTVEEPQNLAIALRTHAGPNDFVIVDCATLWASNLLLAEADGAGEISPDARRRVTGGLNDVAVELAEWAAEFTGEVAIVSNEVGMGVVPASALGRAFRDALGSANRILAARADRVYYLVAGLALELKSMGAATLESFGETP